MSLSFLDPKRLYAEPPGTIQQRYLDRPLVTSNPAFRGAPECCRCHFRVSTVKFNAIHGCCTWFLEWNVAHGRISYLPIAVCGRVPVHRVVSSASVFQSVLCAIWFVLLRCALLIYRCKDPDGCVVTLSSHAVALSPCLALRLAVRQSASCCLHFV